MTAGSTTLEVRGISKAFSPSVPVLSGVDLVVPSGSTTSLLGPSGCGKTTLLRVIAGLERPDAGTVRVGDRELTGPSGLVPPERRQIGMVFQDWSLFPHLDVRRNVGFGLPRAERRESPRIDAALEMVGLEGFGDRSPDTLSGGQQQRVALARALAPEPSVLLLDEPFSNLDASLRHQVRTDVHRLLVSLGVTAVFVTHDQDEAFVLGDEVVVLSVGRVVQHGRPEDIYRCPVDRWTAGFVGQANFVPATSGGADAAERADTPFGPVDLLDIAPSGGPFDVLVRPEHLHLEPTPDPVPPGSADRAQVELVEFVGHSTVYTVTVGDLVVRVREPSSPRFRRGDVVTVSTVGPATVAFPRVGRT